MGALRRAGRTAIAHGDGLDVRKETAPWVLRAYGVGGTILNLIKSGHAIFWTRSDQPDQDRFDVAHVTTRAGSSARDLIS
jgi:hypothetical protein